MPNPPIVATLLACLAAPAAIETPLPPQPPAGAPADAAELQNESAISAATIEIRLVRVDLDLVAEIQRTAGSPPRPGRGWGLDFGISLGDGVRLKPPVLHLGDEGELRIGDQVWHLGAALDDAQRGIARPGSPFVVLTAPRLTCRVGEEATLSVGAEVEWMVRTEAGCLRLADERDGPVETEGVEIRMRLGSVEEEAIDIESMDIRLRRVARREPVEGVPLDVGAPVMREDRLRRDLRLRGDRVAVVPLSQIDADADELILAIFARVG